MEESDAGISGTSLGEIYKDTRFQIPNYQRTYSWEQKQVNDLLDDLKFILESEDTRHYFGTLILQDESESEDVDKNIVDGQQRMTSVSLLAASIIEKLNRRGESIPEPGIEGTTEYKDLFLGSSDKQRIRLQKSDNAVFERVAYSGGMAASQIADQPSHQRLRDARDRMDEWAKEQDSDKLKQILDALAENFSVTVHNIEESVRAGRIFETINDRGKDLSLADKIKSYLVYVADIRDEPDLAEAVFKTFGQVRDHVTAHDNSANVDRFLKEHWCMFTGKSRPASELHREIKKKKEYGSLDRADKERFIEWVWWYLESLEESARAYKKIRYPEEEFRASVGSKLQIKRRLQELNHLMQSSIKNILSLLMATLVRFGISRRTKRILDLLEKFCFRVYHVNRVDIRARRDKFRETSARIYYAEREGFLKHFGPGYSEPIDNLRLSDAFELTCNVILNGIGNYGDDREFQRNLKRNDIQDGSLNDDGWTGFRENESIKYLLSRYNKEQYDATNSDEFVVPYETRKTDLARIWELTTDEDSELPPEYYSHRKQLGNFTLISDPINLDSDFPTRRRLDMFQRRENPKMTRDIATEHDSSQIDPNWIKARTDRIADFAVMNWEITTGANIEIENIEDISEETKSSLKKIVKKRFAEDDRRPEELNNLPTVKINQVNKFGSVSYSDSCANCNATTVVIEEADDKNRMYCANCGSEYISPPVTYHFEQNI